MAPPPKVGPISKNVLPISFLGGRVDRYKLSERDLLGTNYQPSGDVGEQKIISYPSINQCSYNITSGNIREVKLEPYRQ